MRPLSFNGKALTRTVDSYWYTADDMVWIPYDLNYTHSYFSGNNIWYADGDVYETYYGTTYKLNKSDMTWTQVDVGLYGNTTVDGFHGYAVWYDGNNVYANKTSGSATHLNVYIFNHTTKKFDSHVSQDYIAAGTAYIWKSGGNIYYSMNTGDLSDPAHNLMWNRSTLKWELKSWTFSEPLQSPYGFMGNSVWTNYNGETFCTDHDNGGQLINLFKLNLSTSTWTAIEPDGWVEAGDYYSWTDYDGKKQFSDADEQYYMDQSTGKWVNHGDWSLLKHPYGPDVWTDGTFIYHSSYDAYYNNHTYVLKR